VRAKLRWKIVGKSATTLLAKATIWSRRLDIWSIKVLTHMPHRRPGDILSIELPLVSWIRRAWCCRTSACRDSDRHPRPCWPTPLPPHSTNFALRRTYCGFRRPRKMSHRQPGLVQQQWRQYSFVVGPRCSLWVRSSNRRSIFVSHILKWSPTGKLTRLAALNLVRTYLDFWFILRKRVETRGSFI